MAYNNKTCCPPCIRKSEKINPCESQMSRAIECRCDKDFACDEKECRSCVPLPQCSDIHRTGDKFYEYKCRTKSTVQPGTDRAITYSTGKTAKNPETEGKVHEVTLCLILVISILVILSVIFHLFIWKSKARPQMKPTEVYQIPQSTVIMNPKEDTLSCQYPEEERGEKTPDKDSMHYFLNFEC
ncbi:hypothetical protein XENTR_v10018866 [Xenopus tropicalis]|nr:hypothetical protein XENTR_v10018866 [Xenopus tropicalis]